MTDVLDPILGAERWPPMLGVVGFDGGYKSAVALAIPPEGLVGGEGEFAGGPEGIGACCYNDGTCDDITEFDCTSAGGTYQGDGTDCASVSCTGVCCEPGCVDDTTPDGCALDGGTFQGFGTTCSDDPPYCPEPTGACCGCCGVCDITSESDCVGDYQGDGTVCDPNPCTCSGSCGFFNPDDGMYYLTKIYTNTVDNSACPTFDVTCIDVSTGNCDHPGPWSCPAWIFHGTSVVSELSEEHFGFPDCVDPTQTYENVEVGAYCYCNANGSGCFDVHGTIFCPQPCSGCPFCQLTCPTACQTVDPPFELICGVVNTTVTYEDLSPCQ